MSKSLDNCIYLKDNADVIRAKVKTMYTDPNHLRVSDPGDTENNPVFIYLRAFCIDEDFKMFCPSYENLDEMESHYRRGGLGDVAVKRFLTDVLIREFSEIYDRHTYWEAHSDDAMDILRKGTLKTISVTNENLTRIRKAIGIMNLV